jgi:predicted house-cleaning NTP pyrophosphatase (Maf/HAM1 superfamily)
MKKPSGKKIRRGWHPCWRKVAESVADAVVVAGDAVVSKAGRIYEKPADAGERLSF